MFLLGSKRAFKCGVGIHQKEEKAVRSSWAMETHLQNYQRTWARSKHSLHIVLICSRALAHLKPYIVGVSKAKLKVHLLYIYIYIYIEMIELFMHCFFPNPFLWFFYFFFFVPLEEIPRFNLIWKKAILECVFSQSLVKKNNHRKPFVSHNCNLSLINS
jgi:hypothetical protein